MSVFGSLLNTLGFIFDETVTITRPGSTTADNIGTYGVGTTIDDSGDIDTDTDVPAHFQTPATGSEAETWQREHSETVFVMYLPSSYSVPEYAKITRGSVVYECLGPGMEQGTGSGIQAVNLKRKAR